MITILKAKQHNLQSINLNIPDNRIIVVTGVSGSGKSSLVYDIIYQEARQRYLESFSSNTRQLLGKLNPPDVQYLMGLSPAIALEQKSIIKSQHSTVGTISELYDILRLLFARVGKPDKPTDVDFKIDKNLFSFNGKHGACSPCKGLGVEDSIDADLLIADADKTIRNGAFKMTTPSGYIVYSQVTMEVLNQVCKAEGFHVDIPWKELTTDQKKVILYGSKKIKVPFGKHALASRMNWTGITAKPREEDYYKGIIPVMEEILIRDRNPNVLKFSRTKKCSHCHGNRLNEHALMVKIDGKSIAEFGAMTIQETHDFFESKESLNQGVAEPLSKEIVKVSKLIIKLGLGFLNLNRSAASLSGGETQRLRLVKQVASGLRGILYVFDEPSVGLHPKDAQYLMELFWELRALGNTVILVEHNAQIIKQSDWIIDLGPDAGSKGGYVLFNGPVKKFLEEANPGNSKTHHFLNQEQVFGKPTNEKNGWLKLKGASANNLKNIDVDFKLQALNIVSGVSGAGKSSLINESLASAFLADREKQYREVIGAEEIKQLVSIDQSPIGKTPRSNPATYIGLADEFRNLFSALEEAKKQKISKSNFSFNTKGGRCEKCEGAGYQQMGMQMLGTVEVLCAECQGKQFKPEVLAVKYKGKTLADIYSMTIDEALEFFSEETKIIHHIKTLQGLGLGYMKLNQRSSTLSGGEARRIKLAKALVKLNKKHCLYLIDEPSSGLHPFDMETLLSNLKALIKQGHTVILVEHQGAFIKQADHLIDLGPESGALGGMVVFQGNPEDILKVKNSATAKGLRNELLVEKTAVIPRVINQSPIVLKGVETHNLKKVDVEIPFNKLTVVTGVSGSGKSSLVYDTLFMEGRQKFSESFSSYVRTRLNINSEAKYESIDGLLPTIAVNQKSISQNERSTVGTMTGINDKVRLLFSRISTHPEKEENPLASAFSFNHEDGACPACQGLGSQMVCDVNKLISHPEKAIMHGAMDGSKTGKFYGDPYGQYVATIKAVGERHGIDFTKPWSSLSAEAKTMVLSGTGDEEYSVLWEYKRKSRSGEHEFKGKWFGLLALIREEYLRKAQLNGVKTLLPILKKETCLQCNGSRLNEKVKDYKILIFSIIDFMDMPVVKLLGMLRKWVVFPAEICSAELDLKAVQILLGHIINGLDLLNQLGLGYLTLARTSNTLSGGEGQRVRLAACIKMEIKGVCIILDEPTTGLHPRDTDNLWHMVKELLVQGNTVVVNEHDPEFIKKADYVIDMGPKAGSLGGQVVARGTIEDIKQVAESLTGKYLMDSDYNLRSKKQLQEGNITIQGANANNLKDVDVEIPLGGLVTIMGVSGSGKSSLLHEVVYQSWLNKQAIACRQIDGLSKFEQVIYTQQKVDKIQGNSTVYSFLALADDLAKIYADEAKKQQLAFNKSYFLPNSKQGKCSTCSGKGINTTALDFLSDVDELCMDCRGSGFAEELRAVKVNSFDIASYMDANMSDIHGKIENKRIEKALKWAVQLGIDYLKAGQRLSSLSGGEVQRLRILQTLLAASEKATLFLMDEPTTGLHMEDVKHLIKAFDLLIEQGHSLVVIEHHLALIQSADVVIEMGPGAGDEGGEVIGIVTP